MSREVVLEDTFTHGFTTRAFASGIPTTLAGTPVLSVKEGANDTIITAGVSVDIDTGSSPITGLHEATVVATAANGYEIGKSYALYVSTGTVGGVSVVGETLENFIIKASIADQVWDEVLTGGTHNVTTSAGRRLREIADLFIITEGTCQASGQTTTNVRIESGESATDDLHNFQRLAIIGGTNVGFQVIISDYDGTNKDCTVTPAFPAACDATSDYAITPAIVHTETQKGGYQGGQVWIDTANGTAGTQLYVNGVVDNPVDNIADARTLADALGMRVFHSLPGSSFTLAQTFNNYEFTGAGYTLNLGSQDVGGSRFFFGSILGIGTGSSRIFFDRCIFLSATTASSCNFITCNWSSTITLSSASSYTCTNCFNGTNNGIAVLNFGAAVGNTNVNLNNFIGDIQIEAMGDAGTDTMFIDINGTFTEGTCTGGSVDIHGIFQTSGITNLTLTETRPLTAAEVNAEADTALADVNLDHIAGTATGIPAIPSGTYLDQIMDDGTATFNRTTDSLQALRDRGDAAWITGAGGSNPFVLQNTTIATLASQVSFTLTAGSADNAAYQNMLIVIEDSATATQKAVGVISTYTGSSLTVTLREDPGIFTMAAGDTVDVLAISPDILSILADTNELQADDVPGLIAALNDLSVAQVNAEVDTALTDYDGPTNAEMIARTLVAAAYFDPTADAVANVTLVATTTTNTDVTSLSTRVPAALVSGRMDSNTGAMAANVVTAAAIATDAIGSSEFAASAAQKIRDEILPTQNVAFSNLSFLFVAASDHVTPVTGATGTAVTRSINGGAFGAGTGTLAEVSNGMYQYDASAADMNGGIITFRFTGTGGTPGAPDDRFVTVVTGGGV